MGEYILKPHCPPVLSIRVLVSCMLWCVGLALFAFWVMIVGVPNYSVFYYYSQSLNLRVCLHQTISLAVSVTGASFFVFSGALKSSSGYLAKSSIVEGK